jgi:hypothetical protein
MANTRFWGSKPLNNGKIKGFNSDGVTPSTSPVIDSDISSLSSGVSPEVTPKVKPELPKIKFPTMGDKKNMKNAGKAGAVALGIIVSLLVFFYVILVRPALAVYSTAKVLKDDFARVSEAMRSRDIVALNNELNNTEKDLNNLKTDKEKKFGWAKNNKLFKLNEFYSDADRFINSGIYAIDALRETSVIITPFADAAGLKISPEQELPKAEGLMEAFQGWISVMPQVADQMDGVIAKVAKIGEELKPINVNKYPKRIGKFAIRSNVEFLKNTLSRANEFAPDIKKALIVIPKVLAVGTPTKRYMIIMQNDKEIRPTGGFMTNYATFKITNGLLDSDFTSKDMYSIDLALLPLDQAGYDFPDAPPAYMKLLKVERWFGRDMNASPDFITSMDQFMSYYNMAGRYNPYEIKAVDGIFAIDTFVIQELLDVTGPVTVNGVTYTKDNVVLELEKIASLALQEQANRKKVLGDLMQGMLINVFQSDSSIWPKLIEKGVDLATRKHIQIYVFDAEAQALIDSYGYGGRITEKVDGDYMAVISTNLGGDKTNWFTSKEVTHTLEKNNNRWMDTVKIKYTYTQPSDDYIALVKRFRDWVRVYVPVGSELVSVEGSEDTTLNMTDQERNKVWYSGYIELGPGESKEMTFKYYLPTDIKIDTTYNLTIQKQGGTGKEKYTVIYGNKKQEIDLDKDTKVTIDL